MGHTNSITAMSNQQHVYDTANLSSWYRIRSTRAGGHSCFRVFGAILL